jgi:predicted nucleic acid-binding protein
MEYLADTNVLLRSTHQTHPMHLTALTALTTLLRSGDLVYVTHKTSLSSGMYVRDRQTEMDWVSLLGRRTAKPRDSKVF